MSKIRVTIWHEYRHEKKNPEVTALYPNGIHKTIAEFLASDDLEIRTATLDEPEHGLPDEVLNNTDVLLWWGHIAHDEVSDELVEKIKRRVFDEGMGFIALHSAHLSKPFRALVGTSGKLTWGDNQKEIMWNLMPQHPIAKGIPDHFIIEEDEMYGEPFMIPQPDELVFGAWYEHGNIFRAGCCFYRGLGKVFYFQPGHETCPSFHNENVQQVIKNAVRWAAPQDMTSLGHLYPMYCPYLKPIV